MSHKFLEGLTRADIAFEAKGNTLKELFESSANALFEIMVNPKKVKKKIKKEFKIEKNNLEELLYSFLDEVIFLKDSKSLVFNSCKVGIKEGKKLSLKAALFGDKIDYKKQELRVDPKAVTMHKFKVEKRNNKYVAQVIIDI